MTPFAQNTENGRHSSNHKLGRTSISRLATLLTMATLTTAASLATGCQDDKSFGWYSRQNAQLALNADIEHGGSAQTRQYMGTPTNEEVIAEADEIWFYNRKVDATRPIFRRLSTSQRDESKRVLWLSGSEVIDSDGELVNDFVGAEDVVITRTLPDMSRDTIGYIPNSTMRTNESYLRAAYSKGDFADIYLIMEGAYVFFPIVGSDWLLE